MIRVAAGILLVAALATAPGCGKKATPVTPEGQAATGTLATGAEAGKAAAAPESGAAGLTDCERMAEMVCATAGTSPEDCEESRRNAKISTGEKQQAMCRAILRRNAPAPEAAPPAPAP